MGVWLSERLFAIFLKSSTLPPTSFDADAMSSAPPRGVKRKAAEVLDEAPSHLRQTIFNVSMAKLGRLRHSADPSLLRSVLVCNTLRCLERIMEREGIKLSPSTITPNIILEPVPNDPPPVSQPLPPPPPPPSPPVPPPSYLPPPSTDLDVPSDSSAPDYDRYLMDLEGCSGRSTPFIRTVCDSSAFWNDDRLTSLNWSSVLNFNTSSSSSSCSSSPSGSSGSSGIFSSSPTFSDVSLHTLMPPTSISSYTNLTSSSGNSDEIFGDIDLSLYDFDVLSPISPPHVKMAPVSAEELMRCITNEQSQPKQMVQRVRT